MMIILFPSRVFWCIAAKHEQRSEECVAGDLVKDAMLEREKKENECGSVQQAAYYVVPPFRGVVGNV